MAPVGMGGGGASIGGMSTVLRPWTVADAEPLHAALRADPDLVRQVGPAATVEDAVRLVEQHLLPGAAADRFAFAIDVDGTAVGNVAVSNVENRHQTAWVSYWLAVGHRGQGLAVRGLAAVSGWAVRELDVFRLELGHRTENTASCRVATRAGYAPEGVERAKLRYGDRRFDVETHARLATDAVPPVELLPFRGAGRKV